MRECLFQVVAGFIALRVFVCWGTPKGIAGKNLRYRAQVGDVFGFKQFETADCTERTRESPTFRR